MKRWGVRWIFCWLSVLITTACGHVLNSPTPTEESTERVPTLENFIPPSTASPTSGIRPQSTITPNLPQPTGFRLATLTPVPYVIAENPTCYETAVRSLVCLGWVQNNYDEPVTNANIQFYLLNMQGELLAAEEVTTSLPIIPPQTGSPYRAVFTEVPQQSWSIYTEINAVETLQTEQYIPPDIQITQSQIDWVENRYQISGKIEVDPVLVSRVRVIVLIRNESNQITGFRIIDLDEIDSTTTSFNLNVIPLDGLPGEVTIQAESLP